MANLTWTPPSWDSLNFNNCSLLADFVTTCASYENDTVRCLSPDLHLDSHVKIVPLIRSALPGSIAIPTDGQVVDWLLQVLNNNISSPAWVQFQERVFGRTKTFCGVKSVCQAIDWTGNPDISGIGVCYIHFSLLLILRLTIAKVTISYYVEVILTLFYTTVILIDFIRRNFIRQEIQSIPKRGNGTMMVRNRLDQLIEAVKATHYAFFDTALLFNGVMYLASITMKWRNGQSSKYLTVYGNYSLNLLAACSSITMLVLFILLPKRFSLRLGALIVVMIPMYLDLNMAFGSGTSLFENWCIAKDTLWLVRVVGERSWMVIPLVCILYPGIWFLIFIKHHDNEKARKIPSGVLKMTLVVLLNAFMVGLLIVYTIWRTRLDAFAGPSLQENDWTFGQILALAAWMAVILKLLYSFFWTCRPRSLTDPTDGVELPERDTKRIDDLEASNAPMVSRPSRSATF